jgi:hypothetical protein
MLVLATVSSYTEERYDNPLLTRIVPTIFRYSHVDYKALPVDLRTIRHYTDPKYLTEEKKFYLVPRFYDTKTKYLDQTRSTYVEPKYEEHMDKFDKTDLKLEEFKFEKDVVPELKYTAKSGNFYGNDKFDDSPKQMEPKYDARSGNFYGDDKTDDMYKKVEPRYVAKSGNFYNERKYEEESFKTEPNTRDRGAIHIVE